MMGTGTVYLVTRKLQVADIAEVDSLQIALGARFPAGYTQYVTQLGVGYLDGLISVYSPAHVMAATKAFRQMWETAERWAAGRSVLPRSKLIECIPIGETNYQDTIVSHPSEADCCYVLPAELRSTYTASSSGLWGALVWILESDVIVQSSPPLVKYSTAAEPSQIDFHWFESPTDRVNVALTSRSRDAYKVASRICNECFGSVASSRILYRGSVTADLGFWIFESVSASMIHCDWDEDGAASVLLSYDVEADASLVERYIALLEQVGFGAHRY